MKRALIVKMFPLSKAMYHWKHQDRIITKAEIAKALIIVNCDTGEIIKNVLVSPYNQKTKTGLVGLDKLKDYIAVNPEYPIPSKTSSVEFFLNESTASDTIEALRSHVNSHPVEVDSDGRGCKDCCYSHMGSWLGCYHKQCPTKVGNKC